MAMALARLAGIHYMELKVRWWWTSAVIAHPYLVGESITWS